MIPHARGFLFRFGLALTLLALAITAATAQTAAKPDPRPEIVRKIQIPGVKAEDLRPSPIPGLYELIRGMEVAYISSDGKYAIAGDLISLPEKNNLSDERRRAARVKLLASVPVAQMLTFSPKNPKYSVTVLTDIDCGYCRKLHGQMAEYNRLGIGVHYLFYPRSGPGTESWKKAEEVWCSPNRNEALTRAKRGEEITAKACANSPVARHFAVGRSLEIGGTPAIVTSAGDLISGYVEPARLVEYLRAGALGETPTGR